MLFVRWKALLFLTLLSVSAPGEPRLRWRWTQPDTEILGVCPDSTGSKVAVVRRLHWPDGHQAEGAEKKLAALQRRAKKEPRFQDPELVLLQVSGEARLIDWGWDPDFSPGGDRLCYIHQATPATGQRILAATLYGNWLEEWTEASGQHRVLARPQAGSLASPVYSPDGQRLLYELQAAVNGAWPGTIGVGVYNFSTTQAQTLLAPAKQRELDVLIQPLWVGNQIMALRGTPLKAGTYLSDSYQWQVLNAEAGAAVITTLPSSDLMAAPRLESSAGRLWIGSRRFDLQKKNWLDKPTQVELGKWSPDGKCRAATRNQFLILSDASGREFWRTSLPASASSLRWSANSRYLAVICTQMRRGQFVKDEVLLYTQTPAVAACIDSHQA
ncbi:hypothetical protein IV102_09245 [bacterium]|nr:hypothetical protein [bacterium]